MKITISKGTPDWEKVLKSKQAQNLLKMYQRLLGTMEVMEAIHKFRYREEYRSVLSNSLESLWFNTSKNNICRDSASNESLKDLQKKRYFEYIPFHVEWFMQRFFMDDFDKGERFIDIGCGHGAKVILAYFFSKMECHGIEYCKDYVDLAHKGYNHYVYSHGNDKWTVSKGAMVLGDRIKRIDAFDFKGYGKFDRIYTYMPVEDNNLRLKFYRHIIRHLKVGTLWMEVGRMYFLQKAFKQEGRPYKKLNDCMLKVLRKGSKDGTKTGQQYGW